MVSGVGSASARRAGLSHVPMKRLLRSLLSSVALTLGSLLLAFAISEGLVLLLLGEQPKFPRHVVSSSFGLRMNEPGSTYRHKSADVNVRFHIDRNGFRDDRDFEYQKPPGEKRIVMLGDSYTIGYEVEAPQTFAAIIEHELNARGVRA